METPLTPIPLSVLVDHVNALHNNYPKQLGDDIDDTGNCTTFSIGLITDLLHPFLPNGSPLSLHLPHVLEFSADAHLNIITPPDRNQLMLGCPRQDFETMHELIAYVKNPENGIVLAPVDGAHHAFDIVVTDEGVKIADAQYGFVCDPDQWEKTLAEKSGKYDRSVKGHFAILDINKYDPLFSHDLAAFDAAMESFAAHHVVRDLIERERLASHYGDSRDVKDVVFNALGDPEVLKQMGRNESFGHNYTNDPAHPDQTTAVRVDVSQLSLQPGEWIVGVDPNYAQYKYAYMGTRNGILRMVPGRATITDTPGEKDLAILASSPSLDLSGLERTVYSGQKPLETPLTVTVADIQQARMGIGE